MPECDYCGETFDDEDDYLRHLGAAHEGELGRIERRRVEDVSAADEGRSIPTGPAVLVGVFAFAMLLVLYVIFFFGVGSEGLGQLGSAHEHGTIEMSVLGEQVDFSQPEYQTVADRFHFENNEGRVWHKHATGVTLAWGMDTLDIGLSEGSVTFEGTTYEDSDPEYDVTITVNDRPVDPEDYVLQGVGEGTPPEQGDSVQIVVTRANGSG
jgi:hypothetical protein